MRSRLHRLVEVSSLACLFVNLLNNDSNEASHDIIQQALVACTCMEHRGASSADNVSGDGAGKLLLLFCLENIE